MIFRANIVNPENHSIWRRAIQALGGLHEEVKITITQKELIAWSMNNTDTSMCQVSFKRSFFDSYEFKPEETVFGEEGLQQVEDRALDTHKLYSFRINSKHLSVLFRKPEHGNIKDLILGVHNGATCPETLANRFQITIHTENLMIKEYSPNIVPIKYDPIVINLRYKKRFIEVYGGSPETQEEQLDPRLIEIFQKFDKELLDSYFNSDIVSNARRSRSLTPEDEINYLCCGHQLLKNFIDSCGTNATEEVKLEVSLSKLCLTAFTRGIYSKNNDVLRNAMRASNTVSTNDLEHYCLFTTSGEQDQKRPPAKVISFAMKDFRSFVNMGSMWKGSPDVHLWFCHPGDPIFLELETRDLCIELVQVTDSNEAIPATEHKIHVTKSSPLNHKTSVKLSSPRKSPLKNSSPNNPPQPKSMHSPLKPKALFVQEKETENEQQRWKNPIRGKRPALSMDSDSDSFQQMHQEPASKVQRTQTTIQWGETAPEALKPNAPATLDQRELLKQEKKRFLRAMKNQREKDGNDETQEDEQFGPTQIDNPKGLFD